MMNVPLKTRWSIVVKRPSARRALIREVSKQCRAVATLAEIQFPQRWENLPEEKTITEILHQLGLYDRMVRLKSKAYGRNLNVGAWGKRQKSGSAHQMVISLWWNGMVWALCYGVLHSRDGQTGLNWGKTQCSQILYISVLEETPLQSTLSVRLGQIFSTTMTECI